MRSFGVARSIPSYFRALCAIGTFTLDNPNRLFFFFFGEPELVDRLQYVYVRVRVGQGYRHEGSECC